MKTGEATANCDASPGIVVVLFDGVPKVERSFSHSFFPR
jgi:hypothetical protein